MRPSNFNSIKRYIHGTERQNMIQVQMVWLQVTTMLAQNVFIVFVDNGRKSF